MDMDMNMTRMNMKNKVAPSRAPGSSAADARGALSVACHAAAGVAHVHLDRRG
jgi:hypothetical protein